jgi:hypothetical protein
MKKIVLIALTVFCIVALAACSSTPSSPAASQAAAGKSIASMINVDDLNKSLASDADLQASGTKMVVSVNGNTLTYTVTLNQDIDPSNVPANIQDAYKTSMQSQADALQKAYSGMPDWTMAFVVQNKSGQQLFKLSQDVKGQ